MSLFHVMELSFSLFPLKFQYFTNIFTYGEVFHFFSSVRGVAFLTEADTLCQMSGFCGSEETFLKCCFFSEKNFQSSSAISSEKE